MRYLLDPEVGKAVFGDDDMISGYLESALRGGLGIKDESLILMLVGGIRHSESAETAYILRVAYSMSVGEIPDDSRWATIDWDFGVVSGYATRESLISFLLDTSNELDLNLYDKDDLIDYIEDGDYDSIAEMFIKDIEVIEFYA